MPNCMFGQITKEFKEFFYVNCKVEDLYNLNRMSSQTQIGFIDAGKVCLLLEVWSFAFRIFDFLFTKFCSWFYKECFFQFENSIGLEI